MSRHPFIVETTFCWGLGVGAVLVWRYVCYTKDMKTLHLNFSTAST